MDYQTFQIVATSCGLMIGFLTLTVAIVALVQKK